MDDKGKMSWRVEVEPPEDIETLYDVNPNMMIWKSMTGMDRDELLHPSVADLLKAQIRNLDTLPAADIQAEPLQEVMKSYQEAEEDRDHIDHPVFSKVASEEPAQDWDEYQKANDQLDRYLAPLKAEYSAAAKLHVAHSEPEKDEDDLYHRDTAPPVQMELLRSEVRVHFQPEEDMDALYHKDVPELISYQGDAKVDAPVYLTSQRKHSEPEEDLDGLYHQ